MEYSLFTMAVTWCLLYLRQSDHCISLWCVHKTCKWKDWDFKFICHSPNLTDGWCFYDTIFWLHKYTSGFCKKNCDTASLWTSMTSLGCVTNYCRTGVWILVQIFLITSTSKTDSGAHPSCMRGGFLEMKQPKGDSNQMPPPCTKCHVRLQMYLHKSATAHSRVYCSAI